ncbi:hypothetical protein EON77_15550, partial [bacterium]
MEASTATKNIGRIEQIQGVVVEAVFPDKLPEINNALEVTLGEGRLVLEVQQHLGDNRVRTVAMDSTDGLARGVEVRDLGEPITVPVGKATLGRIFNVLGETIDGGEQVVGDAHAGSRRLVHLTEHEHRLVDDARFLHLEVEVGALTRAL